jgi:hypothetical protein
VLVLQGDGGFFSLPFSRDGGLSSLTRIDDTTVFAVGGLGSMALSSLGGVRELSSGALVNVNAVCGYSDTRVYGPADNEIVFERRTSVDGVRWDSVSRTATGINRWLACFAEGPDKVWVTGDGPSFLRQSGGVFVNSTQLGSGDWTGVWGSTNGPWYFVGTAAQIYSSSTGNSPSYLTNGASGGTAAIWGVAPNNIVTVAGTNSHIRTYNGIGWSDPIPPNALYGRTLRAVHGQRFADAGTSYSIVGLNTAWRRVNGTLVVDPLDAGANLRGTWMTPGGDIWAVGDDGGTTLARGILMRFSEDGGWVSEQAPTRRALLGVSAYGETGPFIVGEKGVILRKLGADGG